VSPLSIVLLAHELEFGRVVPHNDHCTVLVLVDDALPTQFDGLLNGRFAVIGIAAVFVVGVWDYVE
jgi:hypothetical protein